MHIFGLGKNVKKKVYEYVPSSAWKILEYFQGAWQTNTEYSRETVLTFHAVFACVSLIAGDISKLVVQYTKEAEGITEPVKKHDYPVLKKPNAYQNRIQFFENWISSKLVRGNAYIFKERGTSGKVVKLHVLNPDLVQISVSESGDVFYSLNQDNLTGVKTAVVVPASEIIHDRFNCLYHPLVGQSPLLACGLAAYQGVNIETNGANFFKNMSRPSGILAAPGAISDETANRLKTEWEANYGGNNMGRVSVLGDDLKYIPLTISPEDAQMVEQLQMSGKTVCSAFHVPTYKVLGDSPTYNNVEALDQQYYSQCLQTLIEAVELCLEEGLEIDVEKGFGIEFDLDGLLRMDSATKIKTLSEGVLGTLFTPNEARKKLNNRPVPGGDSAFLQQQNYSLEALAKRDASEDPFGTKQPKEAEPVAPAKKKESGVTKKIGASRFRDRVYAEEA